MVAGFTTTYAISVYHDFSCEFESCSWPDVFDTTLYDKVCKLLAAGRWEISWGVSLIIKEYKNYNSRFEYVMNISGYLLNLIVFRVCKLLPSLGIHRTSSIFFKTWLLLP